MQKLNKRDLVEQVAEKAHISKRDAESAIDVAFDLIEKAVLSGREVNITNFGYELYLWLFTGRKTKVRYGNWNSGIYS